MEKMLILMDRDVTGDEGTTLTYECGWCPVGTRVVILSGMLEGVGGTVMGTSQGRFPYYEKAQIKVERNHG